jgi:hypothetical protein
MQNNSFLLVCHHKNLAYSIFISKLPGILEMKYDVLKAVTMKSAALCDVTQYSLVWVYLCSSETYYLLMEATGSSGTLVHLHQTATVLKMNIR